VKRSSVLSLASRGRESNLPVQRSRSRQSEVSPPRTRRWPQPPRVRRPPKPAEIDLVARNRAWVPFVPAARGKGARGLLDVAGIPLGIADRAGEPVLLGDPPVALLVDLLQEAAVVGRQLLEADAALVADVHLVEPGMGRRQIGGLLRRDAPEHLLERHP